MPTEIPDNVVRKSAAGWIGYDANCALCRRWIRRTQRPLNHAGYEFVPLQSEWAQAQLNLRDDDALTEMKLLLPNHETLGGATAAIHLMRHVWWLWPLWCLNRIPGAGMIFDAVYRYVARNRHCQNGVCARTAKRNQWLDWIPLPVLLLATLPYRNELPNWIFMWVFVTAMFAGCKWLTWRRSQIPVAQVGWLRTLGYLFAWPGMDARTFLSSGQVAKPRRSDWLLALGRWLLGCVLVWSAAYQTIIGNEVANAWLAMFGVTLILHFGAFHLASLAWQRAGVHAKPLMQSPATATSLADFWGARWNTAFNKLVHDLVFRPMARRVGITGATLGVFAISGIIHELSISFPARGGYGMPFAYFMLQGTGVLIERSRIGRDLNLGQGWRGWLFMFCFTALPAYWLFHPPFVHNVILPMLKTIGAN